MNSSGPRKIFVLGGVRSGKSRFAAELAGSIAVHGDVTLIATADSSTTDSGMLRRIEKHRAERPANWAVVEAPIDLAGAIRSVSGATVIVDCLTVWLSNVLAKCGDAEAPEFAEKVEVTVEVALKELATAMIASECSVVLIANDVGSGVAPQTRLGNVFADMQGIVKPARGFRGAMRST